MYKKIGGDHMGDRIAAGARIRALRESAGLSQTELSARIGIKVTTISNWEVGQAYPQYTGIIKLCKAFGCTADELLGLPSITITADERRMLTDYRRIDDDGRLVVDTVIGTQLNRLGIE
jgi:transcriptional regulator with XRE-family HTH domain